MWWDCDLPVENEEEWYLLAGMPFSYHLSRTAAVKTPDLAAHTCRPLTSSLQTPASVVHAWEGQGSFKDSWLWMPRAFLKAGGRVLREAWCQLQQQGGEGEHASDRLCSVIPPGALDWCVFTSAGDPVWLPIPGGAGCYISQEYPTCRSLCPDVTQAPRWWLQHSFLL